MTSFLEDLGDHVYHDIMACIGCNDCLLACPLPESGLVTIAELNMAAVQEEITAANVSEFVLRCTQCQQCVPACPADLSRADIVLWNKLKVETATTDRAMPLQAGEQILESGWTVDQLARHLIAQPLFRGVDRTTLRRVLLSCTLRRLNPGEVLVDEGRHYDRLLVVVNGALEQAVTLQGGTRQRILLMDPGSFHGYMAILGNAPEPFAIYAAEETILVEFTKAAALRLMQESAPFSAALQGLYDEHALWGYVRSSPLLSAIPEATVEALLEDATLRVLRPGEVIYAEGDRSSDLYLVRAGFLRVARRFGADERVVQYFREGDIAGLPALVFDKAQTSTLSANTRAEVIVVPGQEVRDLLRRDPALRERLAREAAEAEKSLAYAAPVTAQTARATMRVLSLEGLLDEGIVQGHEVLVINTAICTDCNNCVDACGRRHGHTRLDRSGLQLGELLFPTACRHCEDPVCLLCSVNGIIRLPDGEIRIVEDNCIGCGACAERCPYGNINMHERVEEKEGFLSGLLDLFRPKPVDAHLHRAAKGNRVASKCDLCAGYHEYACVNACPVGAAMRIDPVAAFGRSDLVVGLEARKPRETQVVPTAIAGGPKPGRPKPGGLKRDGGRR